MKHMKDVYQIVRTVTDNYDMGSAHKRQMKTQEEKILYLKNYILELEIALDSGVKERSIIGVQCELADEGQSQDVAELRNRVKRLTYQNVFLETEAREFKKKLDECQRYGTEWITKMTMAHAEEVRKLNAEELECRFCYGKQLRIEELERFQKSTNFKLVEIRMSLCGLKNKLDIEKANLEHEFESLKSHISELECKVTAKTKQFCYF